MQFSIKSVVAAGALAATMTMSTATWAADTIKVGILHSLSGTMAISETTLKDAMLMLIEEQNKKGGILGKKLEAVVVDPASNWPLFAEKARELISVNKVDVVFGCWTSVSRKSVLPVFEDILRAGQLDLSNRVRRSNYSYKVSGTKLRLYPIPSRGSSNVWVKVRQYPDPNSPAYEDNSIYGVSNLSNIPFGNIPYTNINSIGRQWIRQYTVALSMEQLGYIRGKFGNIPIPNGDVSLNSSDMISNGRSDKESLVTKLKEMLETMTYDKLVELQATRAEQINKQLKYVPVPNGKCVYLG